MECVPEPEQPQQLHPVVPGVKVLRRLPVKFHPGVSVHKGGIPLCPGLHRLFSQLSEILGELLAQPRLILGPLVVGGDHDLHPLHALYPLGRFLSLCVGHGVLLQPLDQGLVGLLPAGSLQHRGQRLKEGLVPVHLPGHHRRVAVLHIPPHLAQLVQVLLLLAGEGIHLHPGAYGIRGFPKPVGGTPGHAHPSADRRQGSFPRPFHKYSLLKGTTSTPPSRRRAWWKLLCYRSSLK